ncbi:MULTISPECIES: hypothetical protein [Gluconobacter]|uniref:Uncharacterized protein n=1 Tax=Gluconobacter albidus TaxID=318683 RepID=A0A149SZK0_9PROT|nr:MULTISPECIES: hypothetical protein [Gluconobacter]AQS91232.1 hypothetical protein A0U94_09830 [Gluconobacter albidus]KXV37419.1 hypothetical protein AD941_10865 [Gluconobacter albidus]KXV47432.1 hypothetical protein AD945_10335 [Gluconobacter albidus]MBS1026897.1 hypothetical protein [Gluconobacter albidus]MCP1272401.1 hypothetical protein [Gluconobacter albidus]
MLTPSRLVAMMVAAAIVMPACAQDATTGLPSRKLVLWCTVSDGGSKRLFASDPVPTSDLSHMALWNANSRFITIVNSRYNLTIRNNDHACAIYPDMAHATKTRDALISLAQQRGSHIVTVGSN